MGNLLVFVKYRKKTYKEILNKDSSLIFLKGLKDEMTWQSFNI